MARTAAPPKSAPIPTAAVCIGPALVAVSVADWPLEVADSTAEVAEAVMLESRELMDDASAPEAVDSCEDRDAMALLASLVTDSTTDETSELMELKIELIESDADESELVSVAVGVVSIGLLVTVVSWACSEVRFSVSWVKGGRMQVRRTYQGQGGEGGEEGCGTHIDERLR